MDLILNIKIFSWINRKITISKKWIQYCVIASVLLASTVIPFWGSHRIFVYILVLLVASVGLIVLLRQPNIGFIFIFLTGMFVWIQGPSGLNATMVVVVVMLGLWIMDMFVVKHNFTLIRSHILLPIISFLVIAIVALGIGQIPWFVFARQAPLDAQIGGFFIVVLSIGAMLLSAHLIKEMRWLQYIVWVFICLGLLYILGRILQLPVIDRIYHWGFSAESMFWTWLVALMASQIIFNHELGIRIKVFLVVGTLLTLFVAVVQGYSWKSGWLPPLVSLATLIGIRYRKLSLLAIPLLATISFSVISVWITSEDYSWGTRVDAWKIVLEISRVSPFLGMGFSNYYWYTPLFPIRGWYVSFNSHSQYVDLIAQMGYIGLLCFLWLFFALGRLSWKLGNRLHSGFGSAYSYGVLAGIMGTMVAAFLVDWVLPFVYNIGLVGFRASVLPWIFMGGLIAIEQMELEKSNS